MSQASGIEWTDATWNPVTGCTKVSPGCAHCYAETVALRFWPSQYPPFEYETYSVDACCPMTEMRARAFTDVRCHEDRLDQPLRWRKPRRVFVNSMSDLFHEDVPDAFIDQVFGVMALAPQHTFQVLTKRADRMREYMSRTKGADGVICRVNAAARAIPKGTWWNGEHTTWPWANVWLGVSVENQHFADERIPLLLQTPAAVRFISAEPLLERINLGPVLPPWQKETPDWIIVGGESGARARPCETLWIKDIVQQSRQAGVRVFVKQLGAKPQHRVMYGAATFEADQPVHIEPLDLRNRKGADMAEWPEDLRVREFPR